MEKKERGRGRDLLKNIGKLKNHLAGKFQLSVKVQKTSDGLTFMAEFVFYFY